MYKISKEFDFCYGHRVWSQELNCDLSLDGCLKCRHLHGHQGKIIISLEAEKLEKGMVTDFKHLNWFKKWLDDVLDHKFIMDINDPVLGYLYNWLFYVDRKDKKNPEFKLDLDRLEMYPEGYWLIYPKIYSKFVPELVEIAEGLVFVDFVPTSENLSKWIFDIVQNKMSQIGVRVKQVTFYETPKSQSNYYE